ncbi:MAG: GNAT family N-acetyltransferase [Armatimonadetes bacterium]|nr:GNAT family N-acetyltransferase [Armatimonadota bacterium]
MESGKSKEFVTIRSYEPSDLANLVRLQNACTPAHKLSANEVLRDEQTLGPELQRIIFIAERCGAPIGYAIAQRIAGMYHPQKFVLDLGVEPTLRNQGVGEALYQAIEQELQILDVLSIAVQVSGADEPSLRFASKRSYKEQKRDFVSTLDLTALDDPELPVTPTSIEFKSFAEVDSPEFRREWYDLFCEVRHDVPRSAPPTPISFEFFDEQVIEEPDFAPRLTFFAWQDGRLVGFTGAYIDQASGRVDQWLTAVRRDARGQKIAVALKIRQIIAAKQAGLKEIQTDNDSRNTPMLAINERLGFVRQPAVLSMRRDFR